MNDKMTNYLRSNYKTMSAAELAKRMDIPEAAVKKELDRLGLTQKSAEQRSGAAESASPTFKPRIFNTIDWIMAAAVFLCALGLYVYTLSPGVCAGDSGELTSATFFLGGAHSPGYPLYCVVGKFFMNMLPFLGLAVYRLNFFSAFGGALTVAGLFLLLVKFLGRVYTAEDETRAASVKGSAWLFTRLPALAGTLYLMFSNELWAQAIISEVYTLNSLFVPFLLLFIMKWEEIIVQNPDLTVKNGFWWNRPSKILYAFFFVLGFSLGDHHIMLGIILPTYFFIVGNYLKGRSFKIVVIITSVAYFGVLFNIINTPVSVPFMILFVALGVGVLLLSKEKDKLVYACLAAVFLMNAPPIILVLGIAVITPLTLVFSGERPTRGLLVLLVSVLFLALGLCIYLYMPIRGLAYAPLHWGNPTNWERFSAVVLRKQYAGFAVASDLGSLTYRAHQFMVWCKWLLKEFSLPVLLLLIPGVIFLFKRDRKWFWTTASFLLYYVFGLLVFNNFKFTPRDEFFAEVFWIPCYIVAAFIMACGVRYLLELSLKLADRIGQKKETVAAVLTAGFILLSALPFNMNIRANNLRHNWENHYYGENMLLTCDKDAVLFTEGGDNQVFSLLYNHLVEHLRPDMTVWDQKGNVFEGLYGDLMRITQQQLVENQITGDYSQWATGRPMYYTWKDGARIDEINKRYYLSQGLPPRIFITTGILYRIVPQGTPYSTLIDYWDYYKFPWIKYAKEAVHWDYLAREIVANYNFQLGDRFLMKGEELRNVYQTTKLASYDGVSRDQMMAKAAEDENLGFKYYADAAKFGYDMVAIHFNFAIFIEQRARQYINQRNLPKAVELYKKAVESYRNAIDTDLEEVRAYLNLGGAYETLANLDPQNEGTYLSNARKILDKALKISPDYQQARGLLARINGKLKYPASEMKALEDRVSANPRDRQAVEAYLQALMDRGDLPAAEGFLRSVIGLYPGDWRFLNYLASFNAQLGNVPAAIMYFEQMARVQPQNAAVFLTIGELYYRQGDIRRAAANYTRAIQVGSANPQFSREVSSAQNRLNEIQASQKAP